MVSIVVPAFNESRSIADSITEIRHVMTEAGYEQFEIIVVNDGSTDETGVQAEACGGAQVLHHPHNIGYGQALKTGIMSANYNTIVITDSDQTYPIEKVPELLERFDKGFDMVVGSRTGPIYTGSFLSHIARTLFRWLAEFTAGRRIPDINSGLRVFSRQDAIPLFNDLSPGFSFTTSITLIYMLRHKFVDYIPIDYKPRIGNSHVRLFRDSVRTLQQVIQVITYYNPVKIFLILSILSALISVVCLLLGLFDIYSTGIALGVGGILVTLTIFSIGLLADIMRANRTDSNQ